ncbi:bleomycin resistance protein [Roseococcus pinisoli]
MRDMTTSLHHYRDVLGFEISFECGEPPFYAGLCRDQVELHLISADRATRRPGAGAVAIFVDEVDALQAGFAAKGARIPVPVQDRPYGMRDFSVVDPDGNQLTFGMGTGTAAR